MVVVSAPPPTENLALELSQTSGVLQNMYTQLHTTENELLLANARASELYLLLQQTISIAKETESARNRAVEELELYKLFVESFAQHHNSGVAAEKTKSPEAPTSTASDEYVP
jgi:hypothetical protein